MKKTYKIEVDCANCANLMEEAAKNPNAGPMMAFANPELAGRLGLPEGYVPLVGVLVGYALHGLKSNMRNESGNVTWLE